ncbi:MAG: type 4a pilus biogenesis protein PilO [Candidatus Omnitrophica bacterium]|nr:type 4a pilus biogenesis protein PilO [Candidatus Omnitrophota bacterium]
MIKLLSSREKNLFYLTAGVIILVLLLNLLILPIARKNSALNKEISLARTKLKTYSRLLSQKQNIENKFRLLSPGANTAELQKEDNAVNTLSELENLAKNAGIRIIDLRPEAAGAESAYKEMLIELKTEGSLEDYLKFIYTVENSLSLFKIKRLQLNSLANSPMLEGDFSISKLLISD